MADHGKKTILLTGGAGYIGSHCAVKLLLAGYNVLIIDNFSNSWPDSVDKIDEAVRFENPDFDITNKLELLNLDLSKDFLQTSSFDAVIHLAAYKSVPESVTNALEYYRNNLNSLINVLRLMEEHNVNKLIFSSSATVYDVSDVSDASSMTQKLDESSKKGPTNPYGQTKYMGEQICQDVAQSWAKSKGENKQKSESESNVSFLALRYGNPVNSHESGLLPETPVGGAMNLFNVISEVLSGKRANMGVFGDDYPTPDGTGVRDFIHVCDLADAHVAAVNKLFDPLVTDTFTPRECKTFDAVNVGIGRGFSVLEMIEAMKRLHEKDVPYDIQPRRAGDVASVVFSVEKAERVLNGWKAKRVMLKDLCQPSQVVAKL